MLFFDQDDRVRVRVRVMGAVLVSNEHVTELEHISYGELCISR